MAVVEEQNSDAEGPLIFSCLNCRTIIGDSFSLVCTNRGLNSITLSKAHSIAKLEDLITSRDSIDLGSTYFPVKCSFCDAILGRFYITTPKALDEIREHFTFMMDFLSSYEVTPRGNNK